VITIFSSVLSLSVAAVSLGNILAIPVQIKFWKAK
jgi:hypothetical protein